MKKYLGTARATDFVFCFLVQPSALVVMAYRVQQVN